ncbi:hypothetical protein pb186bvf_016609 [Paramecium bursaria]
MMTNSQELQAQQPCQEVSNYQQPYLIYQPYPNPQYMNYWTPQQYYTPVPYYYQPYQIVQPQTMTNTCIINQYSYQNDVIQEDKKQQVIDGQSLREEKSYSNSKFDLTIHDQGAKEMPTSHNEELVGNIKKIIEKQSKGHWKLKEQRLYKKFIENNIELLTRPNIKKKSKFFNLMSEAIKTRSASQCRSHHQKFYPKLKEQELIIPQKINRKIKIHQ